MAISASSGEGQRKISPMNPNVDSDNLDHIVSMVKSLTRSVVRLLLLNKQFSTDEPGLELDRYKKKIDDVIACYQRPLTSEEQEEINRQIVKIISSQRNKEIKLLESKEKQVQLIIEVLAEEIRGTLESNEEYNSKMDESIQSFNEAGKLNDLSEMRQRIHNGVSSLTKNLEDKREKERALVQELQIQVDVLNTQVGTLKEENLIDGLTKIYNRKSFDDKIIAEVNRVRHQGASLSLVMLDIDHFKKCNDTYGHQAGDQVLVRFAEMIRAGYPDPLHTAYRYGGEEFVVLLSDTTADQALKITYALLGKVAETIIPFEEEEISITFSAGIAECKNEDTAKSLTKRADKNLYFAKEQGRNRVVAT